MADEINISISFIIEGNSWDLHMKMSRGKRILLRYLSSALLNDWNDVVSYFWRSPHWVPAAALPEVVHYQGVGQETRTLWRGAVITPAVEIQDEMVFIAVLSFKHYCKIYD